MYSAISKENRRESYKATLKEFAGFQGLTICGILRARGEMTLREIANALNIEKTSVCGRIKELRNSNIVIEVDHVYDERTNRNVTRYGINENLFNVSTIDQLIEKLNIQIEEQKETYNMGVA